MMRPPVLVRGTALIGVVLLLLGCASGPPPPSSKNRDPHGPSDVDAHIQWLESASRDAWQKPEQVIAALAIPEDAVVADVGCGPGYFTRRLSRTVPRGLVYAVDIEPRQLDRLNQHLSADGISNVIPVLAPPDDPRLPAGRVDVILVADTYHHFDHRPTYLAKLRRALAPGGRLVILDYHKRELPIGPPVDHKLAREVVVDEAQAAGFLLVAEPTVVEYQYLLIFKPPRP